MATGGYFVLPNKAEADIDTPASGYVALFNDADATNTPAYKDSAGAVHSFTGPTGSTGAGYAATSTTSLAIGTGSKAFTTQAGLAYSAGARVRATSAAAPTVDYMEGVCTAYSATTLTVTMDLVGGSGTHTDWDLNLAGDQGIQGAGVPPTVVSHGSMGATETFDYGDGPAHEGTYDAALTVTLTGWVAGENILTLYLTTDGTGGYGPPTFGAEVINAADLAAVWDDTASAFNVIVLDTIDSGTNVFIMGLEVSATPTLDAVLAVSSGEDIADALSGAATPSSGNVFATMADVSGGAGTDLHPGTSFPGGPATNELCFRTDLGLLFYYDGTRWLTVTKYRAPLVSTAATFSVSGQMMRHSGPAASGYGWYLESLELTVYVTTTNDGSNYWNFQMSKWDGGSQSNVGSALTTQSLAANAYLALSTTSIAGVQANTIEAFEIDHTKVSSGGVLIPAGGYLVYRLIG